MANYTTELEALNAIYDLLDGIATNTAHTDAVVGNISGFIDGTENLLGEIKINQVTTNSKLDTIHADVDGVETTIGLIKSNTDDTNTKLDTTNSKLTTLHTDVDQVESKLDTANSNLTEVIGETVDVRNIPTDTCIIRVYIGDRTDKREGASRAVQKLLNDGYRPYMVMGISEDLARVLFVKYPAPNSPETPTP